jgi:hypothetical protein
MNAAHAQNSWKPIGVKSFNVKGRQAEYDATWFDTMLRKLRLLVIFVVACAWYPATARAADFQIIDLRPGETVDVYFEINVSGSVVLRIATQNGPGCAEFWWIKWPLGNISSLGRRCASTRIAIPGLSDLAVAGKLRATGVSVPTKIVAAATEQVANSVRLQW